MASTDEPKANDAAQRASARGMQSAPEREPAPETVRYSVEDLRESAPMLLSCSRHAFDGALAALGNAAKKSYTRDDAARIVKAFLEREIT